MYTTYVSIMYFVVESYGVAAANSSRGPEHLLKKEGTLHTEKRE